MLNLPSITSGLEFWSAKVYNLWVKYLINDQAIY